MMGHQLRSRYKPRAGSQLPIRRGVPASKYSVRSLAHRLTSVSKRRRSDMFMPPPAMPKSRFNQNVRCVLVADPAIDRNSDLVRHLVRSGYFVKLSTTLEDSRSFIASIPI